MKKTTDTAIAFLNLSWKKKMKNSSRHFSLFSKKFLFLVGNGDSLHCTVYIGNSVQQPLLEILDSRSRSSNDIYARK